MKKRKKRKDERNFPLRAPGFVVATRFCGPHFVYVSFIRLVGQALPLKPEAATVLLLSASAAGRLFTPPSTSQQPSLPFGPRLGFQHEGVENYSLFPDQSVGCLGKTYSNCFLA